jgi:hypothetical protein
MIGLESPGFSRGEDVKLHSRRTTGAVPLAHATRALRPRWLPVVAVAAAGIR